MKDETEAVPAAPCPQRGSLTEAQDESIKIKDFAARRYQTLKVPIFTVDIWHDRSHIFPLAANARSITNSSPNGICCDGHREYHASTTGSTTFTLPSMRST